MSMFMRLLRCAKPHIVLVEVPTQMKMGSSWNRIKPRSPGLFLILSLIVWENSLLFYLLASVSSGRISTLYRTNFKSLWVILCTVVLEMPTSLDSCCDSFRGYCSRCFFTAWTLTSVLTVTYSPLWSLLSFPTLSVFLNFSTIFAIIFPQGVFLPGNSLWSSLWVRTPGFVEK